MSCLLALTLTACPAPSPSDAGADDAGEVDAGIIDAGPADAGASDAGAPDDAGIDAGTDAGPMHPPLAAARNVQLDLFATSMACNECHSTSSAATANRDEQGRPVGIYEQWSATPMANSVRDPLFRAVLANEIARAPDAGSFIASSCLTCHAPMLKVTRARADAGLSLADLYAADDEGALARDGISCALCHQIQPSNLGTEASYGGGYVIAPVRELYGKFPAPFVTPMQNRLNFTPTQGAHVQQPELCGTCHALVSESLSPEGVPTGQHRGEQLTYREWKYSAFNVTDGGAGGETCQSCHMPSLQDDGMTPLSTRLAHRIDGFDFTELAPRSPFARHTFVGANTLLPKLLRRGRALLNPTPSDLALTDVEQRARALLRLRTGSVSISGVQRMGQSLTFRVHVENRAGHKLPSGNPSRRMFLHVRVFDASGVPLFEVGGVDTSGRILGADGVPLGPELRGGGFHPHRTRVTSAAEPIVWESVLDDGQGRATYQLLEGEGFVKDNRLLPRGHADPTAGPLSTAAVGVTDTDFVAGGDDVDFAFTLQGTPASVEVSVLYQTFNPRFLAEVLARETAESVALRSLVQPGTMTPELVARASATVP